MHDCSHQIIIVYAIGVDVLEEISLSVSQSSQSFNWKGYGLKLHIPTQSLPSNINNCIITIKASLSGQYQFPDDYYLASPIFWLECEPTVKKFEVPLKLEIQHYAPLENSSRLVIVKALSTTQEDLPYSFQVLPGGIFTNEYGVIALDHFCGLGAAQEGSDERRYWYKVFYMGPLNNRKIHFTVTTHHDLHVKVSYFNSTLHGCRISITKAAPCTKNKCNSAFFAIRE